MSLIPAVWLTLAGGMAWGEERAATQPASQHDGGGEPLLDGNAEPSDQPPPPNPVNRSKAAAATPETEPPGYVRTLDELGEELGLPALERLGWLEFGIEQRTRFGHRGDYYPANLETDDRWLMRTRVYLGIRDLLDPFRFGFEFQDSRRLGSDLEEDTSDINEADILQAFVELYLKSRSGKWQPLRLRGGRFTIDAVDRRLVARNRFRNTTTSFQGARLWFGEARALWELDLFAVQPVERRLRSLDRADEDRWFFGATGSWRLWAPSLTLEPYYLMLDEDGKGDERPDREIHTVGLHGYGEVGSTGLDYDFSAAFQFGEDGVRNHRAFAAHAEVGYTSSQPWKPRIAIWVNYASGDQDPDDGDSERFDQLFGASHAMYGYSDQFSWQNVINPALHLVTRPIDNLRLDAFYRAYWLASDRDAFVRAARWDPTGTSGDFIGQEIDLRIQYELFRHIELEAGYAHFFPGSFVEDTGPPADDSDFLYVQTTVRF